MKETEEQGEQKHNEEEEKIMKEISKEAIVTESSNIKEDSDSMKEVSSLTKDESAAKVVVGLEALLKGVETKAQPTHSSVVLPLATEPHAITSSSVHVNESVLSPAESLVSASSLKTEEMDLERAAQGSNLNEYLAMSGSTSSNPRVNELARVLSGMAPESTSSSSPVGGSASSDPLALLKRMSSLGSDHTPVSHGGDALQLLRQMSRSSQSSRDDLSDALAGSQTSSILPQLASTTSPLKTASVDGNTISPLSFLASSSVPSEVTNEIKVPSSPCGSQLTSDTLLGLHMGNSGNMENLTAASLARSEASSPASAVTAESDVARLIREVSMRASPPPLDTPSHSITTHPSSIPDEAISADSTTAITSTIESSESKAAKEETPLVQKETETQATQSETTGENHDETMAETNEEVREEEEQDKEDEEEEEEEKEEKDGDEEEVEEQNIKPTLKEDNDETMMEDESEISSDVRNKSHEAATTTTSTVSNTTLKTSPEPPIVTVVEEDRSKATEETEATQPPSPSNQYSHEWDAEKLYDAVSTSAWVDSSVRAWFTPKRKWRLQFVESIKDDPERRSMMTENDNEMHLALTGNYFKKYKKNKGESVRSQLGISNVIVEELIPLLKAGKPLPQPRTPPRRMDEAALLAQARTMELALTQNLQQVTGHIRQLNLHLQNNNTLEAAQQDAIRQALQQSYLEQSRIISELQNVKLHIANACR